MDEYSLRLKEPWQGGVGAIPDGHTILAEFPSILWGWEGDMYAWILRDPSGRKYIGTTSHGRFCEQSLADIAEDIAMHETMADTLHLVFTIVAQ